MPALRYRNEQDRWTEVLLDLVEGGNGKLPPVTLGSSPDSVCHVHLPEPSLDPHQARILGSRTARDYALTLAGRGISVLGRPIEGIRVLRHGDSIRIGAVGLLYLDFVIYAVGSGSRLLNQRCALAGCELDAFSEESEVISCPWCSKTYHAPCWLKLQQCGTVHCYPVRRMLLWELSGKVNREQLPESTPIQKCWAGCSSLLRPGEEILHCSSSCQARYHPGCWLAMRAPCYCGVDIPALINRSVFRCSQEVLL